MKKLMMWTATLLIGGAVCGMTQTDLQAAIDAAEPGAVVEVSSDVSISSPLSFAKAVTLRSVEGQTNVIRRTSAVKMFEFSTAEANVRLERIVFDGNRDGGVICQFASLPYGTLTLDTGAVLRNCKVANTQGLVLKGSAHLVMETGSEVRGFYGNDWGHGILVGANGEAKYESVFDMKGGLVTDCHGNRSNSNSSYDGAVYVNGGTFNMSGGLITSNTSEKCVAGVCVYRGYINLSGDATIWGNDGGMVDDLIVLSGADNGGNARVAIDWQGIASVYFSYQPFSGTGLNWLQRFKKTASGQHAGMGRLYCQNYPQYVSTGWTRNDEYLYWMEPQFAIGELSVCNRTELDALLKAGGRYEVELLADLTLSSPLSVTNGVEKLTLRSRGDAHTLSINAIWDTSAELHPVILVDDENSTLRLENIVVKGGAALKFSPDVLVEHGRVELGSGAVLEGGPLALFLCYNGSAASIEEGAVIRNCYDIGTSGGESAYGFGVRAGWWNTSRGGADSDKPRPKLTMTGGVISNCVCDTTLNGYGSVVYVHNADFEMSGGAITGNTCEQQSSGVMVYQGGVLSLGGNAVIDGNTGAKPDLYVAHNTGAVQLTGDFTGRVGVYESSQAAGSAIKQVSIASAATGVWNLRAAGQGKRDGLIGMTDESDPTKAKWGAPVGAIGENLFASVEDASRGLPKTLTVGADWQPIVFSGVAANAAGTISIFFVPDELEYAKKIPLTLFTCSNGAFGDGLTFSIPTELKDKWITKRRGDSCVLDQRHGMTVIFR